MGQNNYNRHVNFIKIHVHILSKKQEEDQTLIESENLVIRLAE